MDKIQVHQEGLLHRAFSIFIFDNRGRMLLQQRSSKKYHGGLLWTNACCSHPYPGEDVESAANRRLEEELGFKTALEKIFVFTYHAVVENNLIEHEIDHVFTGGYDGAINPNPEEVAAYAYHTINEVKKMISEAPEKFTSWFKIALPRIEAWFAGKIQKSEVRSRKSDL